MTATLGRCMVAPYASCKGISPPGGGGSQIYAPTSDAAEAERRTR